MAKSKIIILKATLNILKIMTTTNSIKTANKLLRANRLDDAKREYQKLIELRPKLAWNYYYLGQFFAKQNKWQDATTQYRHAIKLNPNSANLHNALAEALIQQGELDEAINYSQKAISLEVDVAIYHKTLAEAYEAKSDLAAAFKVWETIIGINSNHLTATKKLDLLKTDAAQDFINQGDKLNKEGKIKEGVEYYQQGLTLNPMQPMPVYRTCGNNLITLRRFKEAETVFQKLKEVHPDLPDGYGGYAGLTHYLKDWELALERWEEAIAKFPEHLGFQTNKGNTLINLSRFDEAEALFLELKEKYPHQPHGYDGYGRVAQSLFDWELTLERLEDAIAKLPKHFNFYLQKGDVLINLFRYQEAETWFEKVTSEFPHQHEGLFKSGYLASRLGNREIALQKFERAIQNFPKHIPAYCEAARELKLMGRFAEAEEKILQALERDPNHLKALLQGGILASQQSNRELALERFERIIEYYPPQKSIDAHILAATELKYLGRENEAQAKYEQILNLHQNPSLHEEVKLLGTTLTSIQEIGLLLDLLAKKQLDSVKNIISLARLTDLTLFTPLSWSYPASIAKDTFSFLPKLKVLKELLQSIVSQKDCEELDFLVLERLEEGIQLLEKESQRLNSDEWGKIKLVRSEMVLPLTDNLCLETLTSSTRYIMGTDEPVDKSKREAVVKYLPQLMDREKEYCEPFIRRYKGANWLKRKSRQTINIFKDFIWEPPFYISDGHITNDMCFFTFNLSNKNLQKQKHTIKNIIGYLEEIAISKKALSNSYQEDFVFGLSILGNTWGSYQNFGHFLFDEIPSLIFYQKLNLSCKIFVPQITDLNREIFNLLNIPKEKILVKQEHKFKYFITGIYQNDIETINFYRKLRESIVAKNSNIPSEYRASHIYISRRYSPRRQMVNEVEVEELMTSLGFSIVYAERLNFEEKAMLMNHASVVVSPFGSGNLNCLMCHPKTVIVEITPPGAMICPYNFMMCNWGEYSLYYLLGDKIANGWETNIDKLKKVITAILEDN